MSCGTFSGEDKTVTAIVVVAFAGGFRHIKSYRGPHHPLGMTEFARRVEQVSISGIREVFEAAGDDAINLGIGQPDFPTPAHARRGAIEAIESGQSDAYTSNKGTRSLREAIAAKYDRAYGLEVDPEDIIATSGGSEALHLVLQAHVDPGEEVIFPDPGFVSYDALTHIANGTPKPVGLREDLTLDPAAVEDAITDDTAAFVVNSPANPTGAVQSEEDMREFARIADEHDVLCVSDEVYEHIVFDGEHHPPLEFAKSDNVVTVSACSKTYSMTGWRLGWVVGANPRIERMLRVHQYGQACASAPAQYAAEAALTGPQEPVDEMVAAFEDRRDVVLDGLEDAGLEVPKPEGAFYAMPNVPEGWCEEVLERDVIVVPGDAFGANGEGYARLSYATGMEELKDALEIIDAATQAVR
ncbi:aspartate aminotransferase [Natronorubrum daqingense]|uniref:Aspartate aminotransferase n=2 Tax=Natronorubrum daqingense TaxID=588898 RepID=A0A1N7DW08_9EURY|nr:aspartate aminotransferase [Natronorubrum daqingense]